MSWLAEDLNPEGAVGEGLGEQAGKLGRDVIAIDGIRRCIVNGLAAASRAAKQMLATDDAEWDRLRDKMNAKTDAQFEALRAGFRAGIPAPGPIDEDAAARMLALMVELGGEELLGKAFGY